MLITNNKNQCKNQQTSVHSLVVRLYQLSCYNSYNFLSFNFYYNFCFLYFDYRTTFIALLFVTICFCTFVTFDEIDPKYHTLHLVKILSYTITPSILIVILIALLYFLIDMKLFASNCNFRCCLCAHVEAVKKAFLEN